MGISVVFAGDSRDYLERLSLFFLENYDLAYEVSLLIEKELVAEIESSTINTFFIIEEGVFETLSLELRAKISPRLILLTDSRTFIDVDDFLCVFKYQNAANICDKILDFIDENLAGEIVNKISARAKLYIFYSPVSPSGNSLISECFALMKSRAGRRVLYMSMDSFDCIRFAGDAKFTASDFFSAVGTGAAILSSLDKMLARYKSIDYFLPFNYELDKSCLSMDSFQDILRYILEKGEYDYICLDLAKTYFPYAYSLADICEKLVITVGNQDFSRDKYFRYKEEVDRVYQGKYEEKTISIFNKLSRDKAIIECNYAISYDERVANIGQVDDDIFSTDFARDMRGIFK